MLQESMTIFCAIIAQFRVLCISIQNPVVSVMLYYVKGLITSQLTLLDLLQDSVVMAITVPLIKPVTLWTALKTGGSIQQTCVCKGHNKFSWPLPTNFYKQIVGYPTVVNRLMMKRGHGPTKNLIRVYQWSAGYRILCTSIIINYQFLSFLRWIIVSIIDHFFHATGKLNCSCQASTCIKFSHVYAFSKRNNYHYY